jgi:hypothetical protein
MLMLCSYNSWICIRYLYQYCHVRRVSLTPSPYHRQFAKNRAPEVRPAHFNAIISRAFDAVPPPDENYWAQLEHVPAAAIASKAEQ